PIKYSVQPVDSYSFRFDLLLEQPILILESEMSLVLTSNFMQNLQTQQNNDHIIIPSTTEYHSEMQFQILKLLKNLKEGDSEDGLHGRDGGLLGIVSYLSSFQVNRNVTSRSTLKRKRVDAHVGSIPIILMEEKADKNDLDLAKYELMNKFAWPPHYRKLPFVIAIAVANDIISFNKLDRSQNLIDEFKVNLSSQDKWEIFQYCLWAVDQVGPLPPFPFGVSNVRIAEEDFWGREIIINYSVIIKTYIGMKKEDMERVKLFYDTTKGTQYLEKAVKYVIKVKDDESEVLTLYLTPVGVNRKPDSIGKLHIAMHCIVHCVYSVHQRGWCIVDLRWPNVVEQNDCFYVIDAGEFAQHHGKAIHSNMLRIFDPVTVDSCKPATDIYMLIKMMEDTENMWHGNPHGQDFYKELENCYQQNSLSSILNH
ncbi:5741_t:CDS:2, partial [Entrophospora sp. SA101]